MGFVKLGLSSWQEPSDLHSAMRVENCPSIPPEAGELPLGRYYAPELGRVEVRRLSRSTWIAAAPEPASLPQTGTAGHAARLMPSPSEDRRPPITPRLAVRVAVLGGVAFGSAGYTSVILEGG